MLRTFNLCSDLLRRLWLLLSLLGIFLIPGSLPAQEEGGETAEAAVRGVAEPIVGLTRISGRSTVLIGGWAGLEMGSSFGLAGGGVGTVGRIPISSVERTRSFEMSLGYGGIRLEYQPDWSFPLGPPRTGILLGAGNSRVFDPVTGAELASDNFALLEAVSGISYRIHPLLDTGVDVGYRLTLGVEELPGIPDRDLRGPLFLLRLRVRQP